MGGKGCGAHRSWIFSIQAQRCWVGAALCLHAGVEQRFALQQQGWTLQGHLHICLGWGKSKAPEAQLAFEQISTLSCWIGWKAFSCTLTSPKSAYSLSALQQVALASHLSRTEVLPRSMDPSCHESCLLSEWPAADKGMLRGCRPLGWETNSSSAADEVNKKTGL